MYLAYLTINFRASVLRGERDRGGEGEKEGYEDIKSERYQVLRIQIMWDLPCNYDSGFYSYSE